MKGLLKNLHNKELAYLMLLFKITKDALDYPNASFANNILVQNKFVYICVMIVSIPLLLQLKYKSV